MSTVSVFVCPGAAQHVRAASPLTTEQEGTCDNNNGHWQSVTLEEPFDPATLSSSDLGGAFSAGFIVMGTGLAIAWAARQVVAAIRAAL